MASAMYLFVESEGLRLPDGTLYTLPDGTVFGAGISLQYQIMDGENRPDMFTFYSFVGERRFPVDQRNHTWREMRDFLDQQIKHYNGCGMKLYIADHSEWSKATYKKLLSDISQF